MKTSETGRTKYGNIQWQELSGFMNSVVQNYVASKRLHSGMIPHPTLPGFATERKLHECVVSGEQAYIPAEMAVKTRESSHSSMPLQSECDMAPRRVTDFVLKGLADGKLKPVIDKTFPLENIVELHSYLESNQHVGKVGVTVWKSESSIRPSF